MNQKFSCSIRRRARVSMSSRRRIYIYIDGRREKALLSPVANGPLSLRGMMATNPFLTLGIQRDETERFCARVLCIIYTRQKVGATRAHTRHYISVRVCVFIYTQNIKLCVCVCYDGFIEKSEAYTHNMTKNHYFFFFVCIFMVGEGDKNCIKSVSI